MKTLLLLPILFAAQANAQQVIKLPAQDKALSGKPAVQFSIGAEDGEDWELLSRVAREVGGVGPIDLIAADGRYIGTVTGQRIRVAVSLSGRAAYIERDDMDVEKVVVRNCR